MPRRKFPSDGKPWFRCLNDILRDPDLNSECPADYAWAYVRLLAWLSESGSRDGEIELDRRGLCFVMGREQYRHALRVARGLALRGLCALRVEGVHCFISVPKWPIIQGFAPTRDVPREEESRREEKRESHPPLSKAKGKRKPPAASKRSTECPETPPPEMWQQIRAWRDNRLPTVSDAELEKQWRRHADYHLSKGNLRRDWARSFHNWLTSDFYKPPPPPSRVEPLIVRRKREEPPKPATAEEWASVSDLLDEIRAGTSLPPRRKTTQPGTGEDEV